jgi:hypothetical protein
MDKDIEAMAIAAKKLTESPEGQQALIDIAERAHEINRQITEDNRVSYESLHKPMTM